MPLVIPYVDQTWVDGSGGGTPISAARLNVAEAGIKAAHYMPAVKVTHNAAQTATTAVNLVLAFNTERFDTASNVADTMHDTVTLNSRLTCRYAGVYLITGSIEWATNTTGTRQLFIRHQGATELAGIHVPAGVTAGFTHQLSVSTLYQLAVNEYVELVAYQNSGGNLNVAVSGNFSPEFGMVRVA